MDSPNSRLGVCIPTFRRPEWLLSTSLSIIDAGADFRVPLFIVDDSTDETNTDAVRQLRTRYDHVYHIRNEHNLGIDRNIIKCIDLCSSEFAWPIGEDDRMEPDAIRTVLQFLDGASRRPAFIYANYASANHDFSRILKERSLPLSKDRDMDAEEFIRFGAWSIGFIGACVIRKDLWETVGPEPYLDTYFAHVGTILESIRGRRVHLFATPLVLNRSGSARAFTWSGSTFEVIEGWARAMQALVPTYGEGVCREAADGFERAHGISSFRFLLYARGEGLYSKVAFDKYIRDSRRSPEYRAMARVIAHLPPALLRLARAMTSRLKSH